MAHFYGEVQGTHSPVHRLGGSSSGIAAHVRGWDFGVRVVGEVRDGEDTFSVYLTAGSNGEGRDRLLGTFTRDDLAGMRETVGRREAAHAA